MADKKSNKYRQQEHIVENRELNIWEALIPVIALVGMLAYNVYVFGDDAISGSNQFILLLGGAVAAIVGFFNKTTYKQMLAEVAENVKSTTGALLILLMVGALAGTWMISGIIPSTFPDTNSVLIPLSVIASTEPLLMKINSLPGIPCLAMTSPALNFTGLIMLTSELICSGDRSLSKGKWESFSSSSFCRLCFCSVKYAIVLDVRLRKPPLVFTSWSSATNSTPPAIAPITNA